jgi:hypothetical protein
VNAEGKARSSTVRRSAHLIIKVASEAISESFKTKHGEETEYDGYKRSDCGV